MAEEHKVAPTETDTKLVGAFTPERYAGDYPWYWNLTMVRMRGDVVLTVRLPSSFGTPPGATASVRFTRQMWESFAERFDAANKVYAACDELDGML